MLIELLALKELNKPVIIPQPKPTQTIKVEPKKKTKQSKTYKVKQNDTLIKIAKKNKTTWKRIFYKNKSIKNPNNIKVGQRIVIPYKTEKLKKRNYILPNTKQALETIKSGSNKASTGLNGYEYHQCTWYAKSRRPDLPNNLGNADTWYINAQAQGFAVGLVPRVGAIGQQGMHVVYIEQVKGNQVYLSERNYDYNGSYRERWANASDFVYIY